MMMMMVTITMMMVIVTVMNGYDDVFNAPFKGDERPTPLPSVNLLDKRRN